MTIGQEIMVLNPGRKRTKTKGKKTMARKRRTTRRAAPAAKATHRRRRRNPTQWKRRAKSVASRVGHGARGLLGSLAPMSTAKMALVNVAGALAAQFGAKRFGGVGGGANENWEKKNYLFAALTGFAAAALADMIKKGSGKHVLQGALALIGYKIFTNEIAPKQTWLQSNFGEEDSNMLLGQNESYSIGDVYTDSLGDDYVLGQDGLWRPVDDSHRLIQGEDEELLGEVLVPPGRLGEYGEVLVPPGRLGFGEDDPYQATMGGSYN